MIDMPRLLAPVAIAVHSGANTAAVSADSNNAVAEAKLKRNRKGRHELAVNALDDRGSLAVEDQIADRTILTMRRSKNPSRVCPTLM